MWTAKFSWAKLELGSVVPGSRTIRVRSDMIDSNSRGVNRVLISCTPTSTSTFISKKKTIHEGALSNEFQNDSKDGVHLIQTAVYPSVIALWKKEEVPLFRSHKDKRLGEFDLYSI